MKIRNHWVRGTVLYITLISRVRIQEQAEKSFKSCPREKLIKILKVELEASGRRLYTHM